MVSSSDKIKVLIVDDSLLYRRIIRESLVGIPEVEVVGSASNGRMAVAQIAELKPDMITLDFEMPELDGIGVLRWLKSQRLPTRAIMLSSLTSEGATATMQALQEGAFDFVVKPSGGDAAQNKRDLTGALQKYVATIHSQKMRRQAAANRPVSAAPVLARSAVAKPQTPVTRILPGQRRIGIVAIGISTGGPDALRTMLPLLPGTLSVPVVIVQHMPPVFTRSLAVSLDKLCALRVSEAQDGQIARPGEILIAPGGRQMRVIRNAAGQAQMQLTDDPPVQSCRPSVDYLFNSLAQSYGPQTLSVIMTGMGYDGADGCRLLHSLGGPVIAQDEASCVVFGMPRKPVEEGVADRVVPLSSIASEIARYCAR